MKIEINSAHLNVAQCGDALRGTSEPVLVFLHYFGGSSRSWQEVIAQLSSTHRCIAHDLRGFGDSDAPKTYSLDDNADDIAALIEYFGLDRYVLIGHSMGGKIALNFAARRPAGLEKLVLLAPSPPTPEPIEETERMRLLSTHGTREAAVETLCKVAARALPDSVFECAIEDNLKTSPEAWRAWLETGSRENIAARMEKIAVPVTVVAGEKDEGMTPELLQREVVARISRANLVVVPNAGHLLPLEASDEVAALIGNP